MPKYDFCIKIVTVQLQDINCLQFLQSSLKYVRFLIRWYTVIDNHDFVTNRDSGLNTSL